MKNSTIVGHQKILDRFAHWMKNERLANTYLFVGPEGIGKRLVAMHVAKSLLCQQTDSTELTSCDQCPACQQVDAMTHPDLLLVEKPADKNYIPVELFIGPREKRMRTGLCHDISMKPFCGGRRIAIIDDADFLNQEGANCLLKTLEEPPAAAIIILIASSEHQQLPTIRSRSQIVRFQPLTNQQIENILRENELLPEGTLLRELGLASQGSLHLALQLADPETLEFRRIWLEQLGSLDPGSDSFFEDIGSFVDSASKEGATKRQRLRLVAELATQFFRQVMVSLADRPFSSDETMTHNVQRAVNQWPGDADSAAECVERCSIVRQQIAANANQNLVIENLLCDLGRLVRGELMV